jgi:hypothetical protein
MRLRIREWLDKLPDEYRERAIVNYHKAYENQKDESLYSLQSEALKGAFPFSATIEGSIYWLNLYNSLKILNK